MRYWIQFNSGINDSLILTDERCPRTNMELAILHTTNSVGLIFHAQFNPWRLKRVRYIGFFV